MTSTATTATTAPTTFGLLDGLNYPNSCLKGCQIGKECTNLTATTSTTTSTTATVCPPVGLKYPNSCLEGCEGGKGCTNPTKTRFCLETCDGRRCQEVCMYYLLGPEHCIHGKNCIHGHPTDPTELKELRETHRLGDHGLTNRQNWVRPFRLCNNSKTCKNPKCTFRHDKEDCKKKGCTDQLCKYRHTVAEKQCNYGEKCNKRNSCKYWHPPVGK